MNKETKNKESTIFAIPIHSDPKRVIDILFATIFNNKDIFSSFETYCVKITSTLEMLFSSSPEHT